VRDIRAPPALDETLNQRCKTTSRTHRTEDEPSGNGNSELRGNTGQKQTGDEIAGDSDGAGDSTEEAAHRDGI
jgi:hypothetical protein